MYAAPTRIDRAGRVVASVELNGQGPFKFIIDTGANRSALAPGTAAKLGLVESSIESLTVNGVTGAALLPSVGIDSLRAGEVELLNHRLPVLPGQVFGNADGILGIEGMDGARIEVDFANDRVSIVRSTGKIAPAGYMIVPTRIERGGLLMADGRVGRVKVQVIIDTGAERTLGNAPLRDALLHRVDADKRQRTSVIGATPEISQGLSFIAPQIVVGQARLASMPVTFGDLHVFEVWGLADTPAIVIGMDLIGRLRLFAVDYRRKEVQMMSFRPQKASVRRCGPTECQSRIPAPSARL